MLTITIPGQEYWDEKKEEFVTPKGDTTLQLEHSLISLKKWESKWHKPFLGKGEKTAEETLDYIRCMTMTSNVNPEVYERITDDIISKVSEYIENPMTATWFSGKDGEDSKEVITAEVIYYLMIVNGIPFECQKWHLNSLLTLIRVCKEKNKPREKRSTKEIAREQAAINVARRKALHSKG